MLSGFSKFWLRVTHWEFWPFEVLYFPVFLYFVWLALKNKSFFFFTAANPSIDFGGMLGESKSRIFDLLPAEFVADYHLIATGDCSAAKQYAQQIGYPQVCKPDIGERGNLVEVIHSEQQLLDYVKSCPVPFLMQRFSKWPVELGVFFIKMPGERRGRVTSIVQKEFLSVTGDGQHTVKELLNGSPRALLQLNFEHPRFSRLMEKIPKTGECVIVESIGNHCRGTTFLDRTHGATDKLHEAFSTLSSQIEGFYFGRFDLRCQSIEELEDLKNFDILELNGAGAEPGHIYQPGYPLMKGYRAILWHLNQLSMVSRANRKRGIKYWTFRQGIAKMRAIKAYNQIAKSR